MAYTLAGAMVGAILIREFVLLKRRVARAAERQQMATRLEQVTG
jgi:hypothetical protein